MSRVLLVKVAISKRGGYIDLTLAVVCGFPLHLEPLLNLG